MTYAEKIKIFNEINKKKEGIKMNIKAVTQNTEKQMDKIFKTRKTMKSCSENIGKILEGVIEQLESIGTNEALDAAIEVLHIRNSLNDYFDKTHMRKAIIAVLDEAIEKLYEVEDKIEELEVDNDFYYFEDMMEWL